MNHVAQSTVAGLLLTAFLAGGCGPSSPPASVSGQVTFDGMPVREGTIRFFPAAGTPSRGAAAAIQDGNFDIAIDAGLVAGDYAVEVRAWRPTGKMIPSISDIDPDGGTRRAAAGPREEIEEYLPMAAGRAKLLEVTLGGGSNQRDLRFAQTGEVSIGP